MIMVRAVLLNGIPTGLIVELLERGFDVRFVIKNKEWLEEVLNTSLEVINTIRHQSTKELVLGLIENKEKVKEQQFISLSDIKGDDIIVVIAPRQLQQRGVEQAVSWSDLAILQMTILLLP